MIKTTVNTCKSLIILCFLFSCLLGSKAVIANTNVLVFPQVRAEKLKGESLTLSDSTFPAIDFFISSQWGDVKFISEYFWSESEKHFERFQLGYNISPLSSVSLGRFHTPFGYWHTEYHHGNYLQTSITRPAIDEFGEDGGVIPSHTSGILIEHGINLDQSFIDVSLIYGLSALIEEGHSGHGGHGSGSSVLHDADLFDMERDDHETMYSLHLKYRPDEFEEDVYGFHYLSADMKIEDDEGMIDLTSFGIFASLFFDQLRMIGSWYVIDTKVSGHHDTEEGSFNSGYIQLEYQYNQMINYYGRMEESSGEKHDPYLEIVNGFVPADRVVGLRLDVFKQHAIKLEFSREKHNSESESIIYLEWSAVYP